MSIDIRCKDVGPSGLPCNLPIGHPEGQHAHMEWDEDEAEVVETWSTS